jgi:phosphoribosylanthranilate isomerase
MIPAGLRRWLGGARPGVKICGLTCEEDAHAAIAAGADALGFNFYPMSKRAVHLAAVAPWIARLPEDIGRVAVVVKPDEALLIALRDSALFHAIQFHGGESPGFCAQWGGDFFIKACPLSDEASAQAALADPAPCLLLDAHAPGVYGGTGQTIDWTLAAHVVAHAARPIVLSGGLNPQNIATAIQQVRPTAVDTASGVESSQGKKNKESLKAFIEAVCVQ